METILEAMRPFVASIWQLPYRHFDHGAIRISRFTLINQLRGGHGGVLYHRSLVKQDKRHDMQGKEKCKSPHEAGFCRFRSRISRYAPPFSAPARASASPLPCPSPFRTGS